MLHDVESLIGSHVAAKDGETGWVHDFLFDDQSWLIRYLVVDVGSWVYRKSVVLAVADAEQPDWKRRVLHVRLTREQVRKCPGADEEKPVSRQQLLAMRERFGGPPEWCEWIDRENSGVEFGAAFSAPAGIKQPASVTNDPHLRSCNELISYQVCVPDAAMGSLTGFILDKASWHIGYLDVRIGDWLTYHTALAPTRWVRSVSWARRRVYLTRARAVA